MATRNVVLSDQQHALVEELVRSGRYQNASEVLRAGLRLVERQENEDAAKLRALQSAAELGWADVEAGRFDDVADEDLAGFVARLGARPSGG
ncbi:MAG: type II toxin-antitoxin system ParD family antitoxin [Sporichthyaceae bacterium]